MSKAWYVLHTYSGYENKVQKHVRMLVDKGTLKDHVFDVKVPVGRSRRDQGRTQEGVHQEVPSRLHHDGDGPPGPGWKEVCQEIRKIPGVTGFVGSNRNQKPQPISQDEARGILQKAGEIKADRVLKPRQSFSVGEMVRIIDGPFDSFTGSIEEVNTEKGKLRVMVGIFGRSTPGRGRFPAGGEDLTAQVGRHCAGVHGRDTLGTSRGARRGPDWELCGVSSAQGDCTTEVKAYGEKDSQGNGQAAGARGQGHPGAPGRTGAGTARRAGSAVLPAVQREDPQAGRGRAHSGGHHDLHGQELHLHHQDPSRGGPHQEGARPGEGQRRAEQDKGRRRSPGKSCGRLPSRRCRTSRPRTSTPP